MYEVKVYVVQAANGDLLGAKLTRAAAQSVAKNHAPAKVTPVFADKLDAPANQGSHQT